MVDGLFCATLTGRRGGHTPFVQAGAETPDTGAEAVEPDPGSSWEGHSGCVCTGVWNFFLVIIIHNVTIVFSPSFANILNANTRNSLNFKII